MNRLFCILLLFLFLSTPAYAVITDRGSTEKPVPTTVTNDDIMTSLANIDKTLSGLNTKLPTLIDARFRHYESIMRQNDVKMLLGQFGMFLIALSIYALVKRKNERDKERTLTRSEQLLTNIEDRLYKAENDKEVKVVVADAPKRKHYIQSPRQEDILDISEIKEVTEPKEEEFATLDEIELEELVEAPKKPIPKLRQSPTTTREPIPKPPYPREPTAQTKTKKGSKEVSELRDKILSTSPTKAMPKYTMTIEKLLATYRPNDDVPYEMLLCSDCAKLVKDNKVHFEDVCPSCQNRLNVLREYCLAEDKLIKKQLKLGFCDKCRKEVENGGLQRGFTPCMDCIKLLNS